MKRVSFKVAKAIKEAGYPQERKYGNNNYTRQGVGGSPLYEDGYVAPTYIDVWLWLWRKKKIFLTQCYKSVGKIEIDILDDIVYLGTLYTYSDPEEAIEKAIEYLIENNLIK